MDFGKCDVCNTNEAIGVASTLVPFSCAYCRECAEKNAQPEWIFRYWVEQEGMKLEDFANPDVLTYKDGRYVSMREYLGATP